MSYDSDDAYDRAMHALDEEDMRVDLHERFRDEAEMVRLKPTHATPSYSDDDPRPFSWVDVECRFPDRNCWCDDCRTQWL